MSTQPSSMFDLSGKIAMVTGSSRGIGNIVAHALADAGATLVLNGLNEERLATAAAALTQRTGADVAFRAFDVTDGNAVDDAIAWIEAEVGPIEIIVNNAGIQHREPLLEVSRADWD